MGGGDSIRMILLEHSLRVCLPACNGPSLMPPVHACSSSTRRRSPRRRATATQAPFQCRPRWNGATASWVSNDADNYNMLSCARGAWSAYLTLRLVLDYLRAGFEINLSVAVDFTGSNGRPVCAIIHQSLLVSLCTRGSVQLQLAALHQPHGAQRVSLTGGSSASP